MLPAAETAAPAQIYPTSESLTLTAFMQRVVERNRAIQARLAAYYVARSLHRAEGGLYEPALLITGDWIDRQRPNTIELERSLRSGGEFIERNKDYTGGVEVRLPTGGRLRASAGGNILRNNVQREVIVDLDAEYETSTEVVLEQPLLKGAGRAATLAPRRLAARSAEMAYQDYRRHLMQTVAQAEISYWELHLAQEQYRLSRESVAIARSLLEGNQAKFAAGRGAAIDVLEAQAGLAQRDARESAARQRMIEAINRLAGYFDGRAGAEGVQFTAADGPRIQVPAMAYGAATSAALVMSPDVLRARRVAEQEKIRVAAARNQRLPDLSMRGRFGTAGLGYDWNTAWKDVSKVNFPQWELVLQVRIPLLGGIRERNELLATRQRLRQAELNIRDVEGQVRSEMDAAIRRVESSEVTVRSSRSAVSFRETLLKDRLTGREAGRVDTRLVLESEDDLVLARLQLLDSEVEYERALLELQVLQGNLLQNRDLDLPLDKLEVSAREWMQKPDAPLDFLHYTEPSLQVLPAVNPLQEVDSSVEPLELEPLWPLGLFKSAKKPAP